MDVWEPACKKGCTCRNVIWFEYQYIPVDWLVDAVVSVGAEQQCCCHGASSWHPGGRERWSDARADTHTHSHTQSRHTHSHTHSEQTHTLSHTHLEQTHTGTIRMKKDEGLSTWSEKIMYHLSGSNHLTKPGLEDETLLSQPHDQTRK